VAAAVCLSLSAVAGGFAAAPPAQPADVPTHAAPPSGDAAAKHTKRTACLKDAKTKKLVGAEKTSFVKTCIAAP
jgi:psiF repeat